MAARRQRRADDAESDLLGLLTAGDPAGQPVRVRSAGEINVATIGAG